MIRSFCPPLCIGLIVLWTADAKKDPESLDKEVTYAKDNDKIVVSMIEGKSLPSSVAGQPEEYQMTCKHMTESDLVNLIFHIHTMYEQGVF